MKHIYLVRHGETTHNAAGLVQDELTQLSTVGHEQATLLAKRLNTISFQHVLVSDYVRTRQTADYITLQDGVSIEFSTLVREQRRPSEFLNQSNTTNEFWQFLEQEEHHLGDPKWHWSDEENFYDVLSRVEKTFDHVTKSTGDTVIVTHGRFIIFFTAFMLFGQQLTPSIWKMCKSNFTTNNTGLTVFDYNDHFDNWRLKTYNDIAHFAE